METEEVSQDTDNKDIAVEVNVVVSHPNEWKDGAFISVALKKTSTGMLLFDVDEILNLICFKKNGFEN